MFVFSSLYYNANRIDTYKHLNEEMKSKNKKRDEKKHDYNTDAQKGGEKEEMKKKKNGKR